MSTDESGPPDDGGTIFPAYGGSPPPPPSPMRSGLHYAPAGTPREEIPIFTLDDIEAILDSARGELQEAMHPARRPALDALRDGALKRARKLLNEEMSKFYHEQMFGGGQ